MTINRERGKLTGKHSTVLAFLSGKGPNPLPERKRTSAGPLEAKFVNGVDADIRAQDEANNSRQDPTAIDELMAVLRLMSDNREILDLIARGKCSSVSDIARQTGRELSNVSRTLSKMAAYGLVDLRREPGQSSKIPVLLVKLPKGTATDDWAEAYCVARAVRTGGLIGMEPAKLMVAETAVRSTLKVAAKAFDELTAVATRSKASKTARM